MEDHEKYYAETNQRELEEKNINEAIRLINAYLHQCQRDKRITRYRIDVTDKLRRTYDGHYGEVRIEYQHENHKDVEKWSARMSLNEFRADQSKIYLYARLEDALLRLYRNYWHETYSYLREKDEVKKHEQAS